MFVGEGVSDLVKSAALQRLGQPADMVGACLFLLSDEASWITAQVTQHRRRPDLPAMSPRG